MRIMKCDSNSDIFHDATEKKCDCCNSDDVELRSFRWGHVHINACEKCYNDMRKRITYGLKNQHAFHESEWLQQRSALTV